MENIFKRTKKKEKKTPITFVAGYAHLVIMGN